MKDPHVKDPGQSRPAFKSVSGYKPHTNEHLNLDFVQDSDSSLGEQSLSSDFSGSSSKGHPFGARRQWGVWAGFLAMLPVIALAAFGFWRLAELTLAVVLFGASIFRMRNEHSWLRARSRVFDVTVSWLVVVLLVILTLIPV